MQVQEVQALMANRLEAVRQEVKKKRDRTRYKQRLAYTMQIATITLHRKLNGECGMTANEVIYIEQYLKQHPL
jgi:hypothetical protein